MTGTVIGITKPCDSVVHVCACAVSCLCLDQTVENHDEYSVSTEDDH